MLSLSKFASGLSTETAFDVLAVAQRAITADEAAQLPQLPDDWHVQATIL